MTAVLLTLRCAGVAVMQPAIGCLIFLLIHALTGGQWGERLARPLRQTAGLGPWIWPPLALVCLPDASRPSLPLPAHASPLPGLAVLAVRFAAYELLLVGLVALARRPHLVGWSGAGLIALVFGGHFLAADLFFLLEPGWFSSGFPLVWLSICAAAGLAWAILRATVSGADPAAVGSAARPVGLDWGNLLLAAVVFATYTAFMEFLIIWSGDQPREIAFYVHRAGAWRWLAAALALIHLAFPFVLLLLRTVKQNRRGLSLAAGLVVAASLLWVVWLVVPPFTA